MAINIGARLRRQRRLLQRSRVTRNARSTDFDAASPPAREAGVSPAQEKVFGIPELLEAILLKLHPRDLLLSQRTSKTFQAAVKCSPSIQKKLFLTPSLPPTKEGHQKTINPFLSYILRRNNRLCDVYVASGEPGQKARGQGYIGDRAELFWEEPVKIPQEQFLLVVSEAVTRPQVQLRGRERPHDRAPPRGSTNESWKKMLVADQPCLIDIRHIEMHGVPFMKTMLPETLDVIAELLEELDIKRVEAYDRALKAQKDEVWG